MKRNENKLSIIKNDYDKKKIFTFIQIPGKEIQQTTNRSRFEEPHGRLENLQEQFIVEDT